MLAREGLACLLLLAACKPTLPAYTVHVPPRTVDVRPPRSVVFARAEVPLASVREALESVVPPSMEGAAGESLRWKLERQPVRFAASKDGLVASVAEVGELEISVGPLHCRSANSGFVLTAAARPRLTSDGMLALGEPRVEMQPLAPLRCGGVPVPLGALLGEVTAPLARAVALGLGVLRLPLGPLLDRAIDELGLPHPLELDGKPACLDLDPRELVLAPVGGEGASLTLKVGVDVAPRLSLHACPKPEPRPRPEARVREAALGGAFTVEVALAIPHQELERRLSPLVVGQRYGEGARSVVVPRLELGDAGGRVLARVEVDGAFAGALYLWGTPVVVERGGRFLVEIPDLQAAAETRSLVARIALWLWKTRDGGLEAALRSRLSFDVTAQLTDAQRALTRRWDSDKSPVALRSTLDRIVPGVVESRPGVLVAHARLVGHAEIE